MKKIKGNTKMINIGCQEILIWTRTRTRPRRRIWRFSRVRNMVKVSRIRKSSNKSILRKESTTIYFSVMTGHW